MPEPKPFPHIYRHGPASANAPYLTLRRDPEMRRHLSAYEILKKDLRRSLEYIEPAPTNLATYSHRLLELLLRASTEVESLFRLVFKKNRHETKRSDNILRFSDLEGPMKLSAYIIGFSEYSLPPIRPFESFADANRKSRSPDWYRAYNASKHNRAGAFAEANLKNVFLATAGVYVMLLAQVGHLFDSRMQFADGHLRVVMDLFTVEQYPSWSESERYEFQWDELHSHQEPYAYHPIPERP